MKLQLAFAAWLTASSALGAGQSFNVLVFSKTLMYRHASITNGIAAIKKLGVENNFKVEATEDSARFTPKNLAKYEVIVFLSTSGDVLNEEQQDAFQGWLRGGKGFVGVHAGVAGKVATEGSWPWYTKLFFTENYQIGFVDIADTPYPETVAASREVASVVYQTRLAE